MTPYPPGPLPYIPLILFSLILDLESDCAPLLFSSLLSGPIQIVSPSAVTVAVTSNGLSADDCSHAHFSRPPPRHRVCAGSVCFVYFFVVPCPKVTNFEVPEINPLKDNIRLTHQIKQAWLELDFGNGKRPKHVCE